jgi:hypothetical protein
VTLRRLLADRPERYAVLSVVPGAPARDLYLRAGWTKVGDSAPTANNPRPAMEIMHLPLPGA